MYNDILLPIDLTHRDTQAKAVATAAELARKWNARLHVLTVVPDLGSSLVASYFPPDFEKKAMASAADELRTFADQAIGGDIPVQHIVSHGTIYSEIMRYADKTGCDLIVMASHRPELKDYLLGPNAARVVRHANQSVLVVRD
ncbi:MAG: universal stress protein [Hyphomicrobiales bacterium]|nr:universal stress protein [Hyphomicrobiales bacterium]